MKKVRFLHIADLHLDSPFIGLQKLPSAIYEQIKEAIFLSFKRSITKAIEEAVDFVVIAGDIYDSEDLSIRAQVQFHQQMMRLKEAAIPVYLIHGNHDFRQNDQEYLTLPDNVHIFGEEVSCVTEHTKQGVYVNLYGFSYYTRHVNENISRLYEITSVADFHIALLHGSELTHTKEHDVYAPFSLLDLTKKGFDYWALGHIHKRELLYADPAIYYPGNIQGRNSKEQGEKGCTIVTLSSDEPPALEFFPTAPIIWWTETLSFKTALDKNTLFRELQVKIKYWQEQPVSYLLDLNIKAPNYSELLKEDWLEAVNELAEPSLNTFVWINRITFSAIDKASSSHWWQNSFMKEEWQEAQADLSEEGAFFKEIESLYFHAGVSRFLADLKADERAEIIQSALSLLGEKMQDMEGADQ